MWRIVCWLLCIVDCALLCLLLLVVLLIYLRCVGCLVFVVCRMLNVIWWLLTAMLFRFGCLSCADCCAAFVDVCEGVLFV